MFGESDSESPRVPSPWDNLISASASPSPSPIPLPNRGNTPSPLASELQLIPRLVPESDDGNVEYKLQLLNPSPARFARLVTQLKWRLLEGGGQAYYELGVADSGDLIGLPREELEQTLETLEMMAGEIGASVIVVKEVEVPAALARLARKTGDRRRIGRDDDDEDSSSAFNTETEGSASDANEGDDFGASAQMFTMDTETETDANTPRFAIDLEISSVFKPRPTRTRVHNFHAHLLVGGKTKRTKKPKHFEGTDLNGLTGAEKKAQNRRQARDKKREEKRKALLDMAAQAVAEGSNEAAAISAVTNQVVKGDGIIAAVTESLDAVKIDAEVPSIVVLPEGVANEDDDDVFGLPSTRRTYPTFSPTSTGESHLDVDPVAVKIAGELKSSSPGETEVDDRPRLIVEALVVRKMSLEEGFLDFGGFSIL